MSSRITSSSRAAATAPNSFANNQSSLELNKEEFEPESRSAENLSLIESYFGPIRSVRLDSDTTHIDLEETALRENCKVWCPTLAELVC